MDSHDASPKKARKPIHGERKKYFLWAGSPFERKRPVSLSPGKGPGKKTATLETGSEDMKKTLLSTTALGLFLALSVQAQLKAVQPAKAKDPSLAAYEKLMKEKAKIVQDARKGATDRRTFYAKLRKGLAGLDKDLAAFLKKFPKSPKVMAVLNERIGLLGFLGKRDQAAKVLEQMKSRADTVEDIKSVAMALARQKRSAEAGKTFLDAAIKKTKDKEKKASLALAKSIFENTRDKEAQKTFLKNIIKAYPGTKAAKLAATKIKAIDLAEGMPPLDISDFKDIEGKPIRMEDYKGKVLLIDFWATWCGPCIGELPNVLEAYKKYHAKGFEILSISFDSDRSKFEKFIKERGMTWRHYFDGKRWGNEIGALYNIRAIPHTILVGKDGKIAAINLRGGRLIETVRELIEGDQG